MKSTRDDAPKDISRPNFAWAFTEAQEGMDLITVYRSPLVRWSDPWLAPVTGPMGRRCFCIAHEERRPDPTMMWGEAIETRIQLYHACPGEGVAHSCSRTRTSMPSWMGQQRQPQQA